MTSILDLPPEIMRLILEELYCEGYQFNHVINVCQQWRRIVLSNVFRGPTQTWVYSQNHGCLVAYRGSEETSRLRRLAGCIVRYGGVPLRLYLGEQKDCGNLKLGSGFENVWGFWRSATDVKVQIPGRVNMTAFPEYKNKGPGIWAFTED